MHVLTILLFSFSKMLVKTQSDQKFVKPQLIPRLRPIQVAFGTDLRNLSSISSTTVSPLELLLKNQIKGAQCAARCSTLEKEEDSAQCKEVCSHILVSNSPSRTSSRFVQTSSLCSFPLTCGKGCQKACKPPAHSSKQSITSLTISSSFISWQLSSSQPVVFLVAGKDPGGKWHLVATTFKSSLAINSFSGFTHLRLLAVTSSGVADRRDFNLDDVKEEKKKQTEGEEKVGGDEGKEEEKKEEKKEEEIEEEHYTFNFSLNLHSLSFLALPGCLAILLLFLLLLIEKWCNVRKRNKRVGIQNLESVVVQTHENNTNRETKNKNRTIQKPKKPDELSSSRLPTYVEATQSFDPVVEFEKEKKLKLNMKKKTKEKTKENTYVEATQSIDPVFKRGKSLKENKKVEKEEKEKKRQEVPDFSKKLANSSSGPEAQETSPVFSIVSIRLPTAVDNFYEDFENPYGLKRSNSFRFV